MIFISPCLFVQDIAIHLALGEPRSALGAKRRRGANKTVHFNENQRQYLDDKFEIGQESGHKADPEIVSRDMR